MHFIFGTVLRRFYGGELQFAAKEENASLIVFNVSKAADIRFDSLDLGMESLDRLLEVFGEVEVVMHDVRIRQMTLMKGADTSELSSHPIDRNFNQIVVIYHKIFLMVWDAFLCRAVACFCFECATSVDST